MSKVYRIFNHSGQPQVTDFSDGNRITLQHGKHVDLDSVLKMGKTMRNQLDRGLFKARWFDIPDEPPLEEPQEPSEGDENLQETPANPTQAPQEASEAVEPQDTPSVEPKEPQEPSEGLEGPKADDEKETAPVEEIEEAPQELSQRDQVKDIVKKMLEAGDQLTSSGKPRVEDLEDAVKAAGLDFEINAAVRNELFDEVTEDNEG